VTGTSGSSSCSGGRLDGRRPSRLRAAVHRMGTMNPRRTRNRSRSLLYIAGYGRSGSTVLDIALSAHPDVVGVGELGKAFSVLRDDGIEPSQLWSAVADRIADEAAHDPAARTGTARSAEYQEGWLDQSARTVAKAEKLFPGTAFLPWSARGRTYLRLQRRLLDVLYSETDAPVLVETAMPTAWRLPLLTKLDRAYDNRLDGPRDVVPDISCVILVRRLADVVRSVRSGHGDNGRRHRLPTARSFVGWTAANTIAVVLGLATCGRQRVRLVRYERFCSQPAATLMAMHRWVGLQPDVDAVEHAIANGFSPGEQIYGNRVRKEQAIRIESQTAAIPQGPTDRLADLVDRIVDRTILRWVQPLATNDPIDPADPIDPSKPTHPADPIESHRHQAPTATIELVERHRIEV